MVLAEPCVWNVGPNQATLVYSSAVQTAPGGVGMSGKRFTERPGSCGGCIERRFVRFRRTTGIITTVRCLIHVREAGLGWTGHDEAGWKSLFFPCCCVRWGCGAEARVFTTEKGKAASASIPPPLAMYTSDGSQSEESYSSDGEECDGGIELCKSDVHALEMKLEKNEWCLLSERVDASGYFRIGNLEESEEQRPPMRLEPDNFTVSVCLNGRWQLFLVLPEAHKAAMSQRPPAAVEQQPAPV